MRLEQDEARDRFAAARVARLATVSAQGMPHLVPVTFVLDARTVYTAVDGKPKTTTRLRRLANIATNPHVALLADHYADDWSQLWWVRADGIARIADGDEEQRALALLSGRYAAYSAQQPPGPVIAIDVHTWTGWAAQDPGQSGTG